MQRLSYLQKLQLKEGNPVAPVWQICAILVSGGLFLFGLGCVIYVSFKYLSMAIGLDAMLSRQLQSQMSAMMQQPQMAPGVAGQPNLADQLRQFMSAQKMPQTDGEFIPYSDEEAAVREEVEKLRKKGLSEEELNNFVNQAVGANLDEED